jgi:hypothetical protein
LNPTGKKLKTNLKTSRFSFSFFPELGTIIAVTPLRMSVWANSHTRLSLQMTIWKKEVEGMPGNKEKVEEAAEKTGEAVGKGLREGARVVKRVGKGIKKEFKKKE